MIEWLRNEFFELNEWYAIDLYKVFWRLGYLSVPKCPMFVLSMCFCHMLKLNIINSIFSCSSICFWSLDIIICRQSANKNQSSVPKNAKNSSLLEKTCDLLRNFPEYFDVVVSVARKTDGRHWADLFSAAGRSTEYIYLLSLFLLFFTLHC